MQLTRVCTIFLLLTAPHAFAQSTTPALPADVRSAVDLPPISIDVTNAGFDQVINALSTATGAPMRSETAFSRVPTGRSVTLKLDNKPFWEVMLAIDKQQPMQMLAVNGEAFTFGPGGGFGTGGQIVHGFYIYPYAMIRQRKVDYQLRGGPVVGPELLTFNIRVASDPRIRVVASKTMRTLGAVDDAGNVLSREVPEPTHFSPQNGHHWGFGFDMPVPAKPGRTIAFRGEQRVVVAVGETTVEFPDIEKLPVAIQLSRQTLTITRSNENIPKGGTRFNIAVQSRFAANPPPGDPRPLEQLLYPMTIRLVDANATEVWTSILRDPGTYSTRHPDDPIGALGGLIFQAPLKVIVTEPAKTAEVVLPFEFKNLAIPGQ